MLLHLTQLMLGNEGAITSPIDTTINWTPIVLSAIGGVFAIINAVAVALINSRMSDKTSAAALDAALTNSLGAVKQAVASGLATHPLQASIPGITPAMAAGAQYVLDNAGTEAERFGITPTAIVAKIDARLGLQS